ncbi:hypothetical protein [Microbacterium arborescens]|uniref:hypothetical protein n=1 Tax=Microbacterium arborescens TaxID=33883 RepID=UPI00277F13E9|nr:hypothetical protein [Microbacterium arborescens]MDQ1217728.1 hypothetical protein [Microbacterium arborescens]
MLAVTGTVSRASERASERFDSRPCADRVTRARRLLDTVRRFYVNVCGFHSGHPLEHPGEAPGDEDHSPEVDEDVPELMFRFEKVMPCAVTTPRPPGPPSA